tara:strand:- start:12589 stop:13338 length:750 start_codon:yes stop_codon:yes gene_type:complete
MDANAGIRAQQKQRAREKDATFAQEKLKFFNKEVSFEKTLDRNTIGYTRDISDAYVQALYTQGKGRKQVENVVRTYFAGKKVNEGGRSTRFGVKDYKNLLNKRAEVDSIVDNLYGRNMAYAQELGRRRFMSANAQGREQLGLPASYGAPVMLSPTNRLGGALSILSSVASIGTSFGIFPSDIKAKENIEQVGVSPQGYKIYEFNYKGGDVRFRGAMAQDVLKKNPMAVGIDQNYLTVDYSKIDVNMEVV